jgi:streptogramin lyase
MRHRSGLVAAVFVLLLARAPLSANIPGATATSIAVPAGTSFWYLAAGPDGNLWVSDIGNVRQVGKLTANGTFTGYPLAGTFGANPLPYAITAGPDGNIWFTVARRTLDGSPDGGAIGRITPAGAMTAFPLPTATGFDNAYGLFILTGPDGNIWFSEQTANKIGKITPSGTITEYNIPTPYSLPQGATSGPDGNLWFTEYFSGKIARITPQGSITEFRVPAPGNAVGPNFIATSPDGTLWFTEIPNFIWSMNTSGSFLSHQTLATGTRPSGIVLAGDGNLYFGESGSLTTPIANRSSKAANGRFHPTEVIWGTMEQVVPSNGALSGQSLAALPGAQSGIPFQFVKNPFPGSSGASIIYTNQVYNNQGGSDFDLVLFQVPGGTPCDPPGDLAISYIPGIFGDVVTVNFSTDFNPNTDTFEMESCVFPNFPSKLTNVQRDDDGLFDELSPQDNYFRVRARRTCPDGSELFGPWSNTLDVGPPHSPAAHLGVSALPQGDTSSTTIIYQNTGTGAANVQTALNPELQQFLNLSSSGAHLQPGETTTTLVFPKMSTARGFYAGTLAFSGAGEKKYAPVAITFPSSPLPAGSVTASLTSGDGLSDIIVPYTPGSLLEKSFVGTLAVTAPPSSGPVSLAWTVGPGGAWVDLSGVPASVAPGASVPVTFWFDPTKLTSAEGLYGFLRTTIFVQGATLKVHVINNLSIQPGDGRQTGGLRTGRTPEAVAPPGGTSVIIPTAVNAANPTFNVTYRSDAWIRNESVSDVTATLYYTPDGVDGLAGAGVLKTTIPLPAATTTFLHDLVGMIFGQIGSGQIEIRSDRPQYLSVRSTTEATTGGDPTKRFGTEIPVVSWGAGAVLGGGEAVIPGVSDDNANRTNLVLTETTGSAATVSVTVYDATGAVVGTVSPNPVVPPYGKVQLNRLVALASPGATLSSGWASVRVIAGSGHVVPLATVVDNASNSFSAVRGRLTASGAGLSVSRASSLIVPSLARLTGAFNTSFVSSLRLVNAASTAAALTLTYFYNDRASGQALTARKTTTLPARGALSRALGDDVVGSLFGLTSETYGWVRIEGDVSNLAAVAAISALVDSADPSKGLKTSQVDGLLSSAPEVMATLDVARRFAGVESSTLKRTNLILVETAGQAGTVLVEVQDREGFTIGQKSYPLAANQYFQINNVVSDAGGAGGQGVLQDVIVRVSLTSGTARAVAFVSVNDNVSRNPEIFFLRWPGPPSAFGSY